MATPDNPAGRLHQIFSQALTAGDKTLLRDVWGSVFGVDSEDNESLLILYTDLILLTRKAKESVERLQVKNHEVLLRPFSNIERAFAETHLHVQLAAFRKYLDPTTMYGLEVCSEMLSSSIGENIISEEDLAKLQKEVESLLETIMKANMPEELKLFLVERLEDIRQAILAYRIRGAYGLKQALENTIGAVAIYRRPPELEQEKFSISKATKEILSRFDGIILSLSKMVALAQDIKELVSENIPPLLGPGS